MRMMKVGTSIGGKQLDTYINPNHVIRIDGTSEFGVILTRWPSREITIDEPVQDLVARWSAAMSTEGGV